MDPVVEGTFAVTYRILRFTDGQIRGIKARGKVYFNVAQKAERVIGTWVDVTDERESAFKQEEFELKMRLTMQASAIGSFEWNIDRNDFKYSSRLAEIFGYSTSEELVQEDFSRRIHPDDSSSRLTAHETAFKTGLLFYESRIILPDQSIRWVRVNGYTIFDDSDKPQRMYGTVLDITDSKLQANLLEQKVKEKTSLLKRKTGELKRSEERYHKMTDEVQDYAIILLDEDGNIVNWNMGAEKIKGYSEDEIKGKNFSIFYLDEDRKNK
jgi:PAS domain S-box-containing protein